MKVSDLIRQLIGLQLSDGDLEVYLGNSPLVQGPWVSELPGETGSDPIIILGTVPAPTPTPDPAPNP